MIKPFERVQIKRNHVIRARLTQAEQVLILQKASDCGMSASDYLRSCALGKPVRSKAHATSINRLIQLNAELKACHKDGIDGASRFEVLLGEIAEAIENIPHIIDGDHN